MSISNTCDVMILAVIILIMLIYLTVVIILEILDKLIRVVNGGFIRFRGVLK